MKNYNAQSLALVSAYVGIRYNSPITVTASKKGAPVSTTSRGIIRELLAVNGRRIIVAAVLAAIVDDASLNLEVRRAARMLWDIGNAQDMWHTHPYNSYV
jgi:hypothetical protein